MMYKKIMFLATIGLVNAPKHATVHFGRVVFVEEPVYRYTLPVVVLGLSGDEILNKKLPGDTRIGGLKCQIAPNGDLDLLCGHKRLTDDNERIGSLLKKRGQTLTLTAVKPTAHDPES